MAVAALYDIHGNLPALRAVLTDAAQAGVDSYVVGGDVAAGPLPASTIEELMGLGERAQFVRGNADREVVEAYDAGQIELGDLEDPAQRAAVFAASRISSTHRDFLAGFVPSMTLAVPGLGPVLFCHGSPRSDTEIITRITSHDRLRAILDGVDEAVVVCGHTHQQFDRLINGYRVVNAGSVGIPYEGRPGAYWALLGPAVELRRTDYDLTEAVGELRRERFEDLDEMLKESLLEPVGRDEVSELFERQALRG
jgi:predicted phosphodiesterase